MAVCHGNKPEKQLKIAEGWLKPHSDSVNLFICLGRLSLANRLWGKAKDYLTRANALQETAEAYQLLGRLHEQLQQHEQAFACYKQSATRKINPIIH